MFDPAQPFLLLDDAASGRARLLTGLVEAVQVDAHDEVPAAIARLAEPGPWGGFLGFEAGHALESRLAPLRRTPPPGQPLAWLGRFARDEGVDAPALLTEWAGRPAGVGAVQPAIAAADHARALARLQRWIAAGDIYQANLTFPAEVAVSGHPLSLYARLRAGSAAPFGAVLFTGALWLLSLSPELFFRLDGRRLTARPMKGTARRGRSGAEDAAAREGLAGSAKNRAENLMITDLIRNDLSRVADDVAVPSLFAVEAYPTVLQMTSTVTATARPGVTAADVLAALFPCGSVTGPPRSAAWNAWPRWSHIRAAPIAGRSARSPPMATRSSTWPSAP